MSYFDNLKERCIPIAQRYHRRYGVDVGDLVGFTDLDADRRAYVVREINPSGTLKIGFRDEKTGVDIETETQWNTVVDVTVVRRLVLKLCDRDNQQFLRKITGSDTRKA